MGNINIQARAPPAAENQNSSMMEQQHEHQHPQHAPEATRHLERLLAAATILNPMGNIGPESHPYYYPSSTVRHHPFHHGPSSPTSSIHSGRSYSSLSIASRTKNAGLQHLCSLVTFLLGGPMPPTPGVIPLCWEELVDWTEEATALTESVDTHYHKNVDNMMSRDEAFNPKPLFPFSNSNSNSDTINNNHGIQFVPYVAIFESNENLKKLASQTYMERARFYQESVIIAVKQRTMDGGNHHNNGNNKDDVLCLISLFQFCRYFTLLRRISDSQALLLEYPPVKLVAKVDSSLLADDNDGRHSVTDTTEQDPLTISNLGDPLLQSQCANINNTASIPGSLWLTQSPSELFVEEEPEELHPPPPRLLVEECAICMDKPEYAVLNCCSHGLCRDCEKQWVRKRLCCPFCRKSFKSVKDVVQTQWQLSVTAVPVEQVRNDIACLEHKIRQFWKSVPMASCSGGEGDDCGRHSATEMASILAENYVERPRSIVSHDEEPVSSSFLRVEVDTCDNPARCEAEEGFVVIQQLSLVVGTAI